jgi:hypothetical protein
MSAIWFAGNPSSGPERRTRATPRDISGAVRDVMALIRRHRIGIVQDPLKRHDNAGDKTISVRKLVCDA